MVWKIPLLAVAMICAGGATGASFDCAAPQLRADEKAICASRVLNDADVRMVTSYDILLHFLAMGSAGNLRDSQRSWLMARQGCGADKACLLKSYAGRQAEIDAMLARLPAPL